MSVEEVWRYLKQELGPGEGMDFKSFPRQDVRALLELQKMGLVSICRSKIKIVEVNREKEI